MNRKYSFECASRLVAADWSPKVEAIITGIILGIH